jgi:hypothetical protein
LILGAPASDISDPDGIRDYLYKINKVWFSKDFPLYKSLQIDVLHGQIPEFRICWPETVIQEAFNVIYKNACEAALTRGANTQARLVKVQIQAVPALRENQKDLWYLDIVLENTGGRIPSVKLSKLNDPNPKPLDPDEGKEGSTGIGVFLARYQLQNNVGDGADIFFVNLGNDIVQTRLRLPASLEEKNAEVIPGVGTRDMSLVGDYILYVEDNPNEYREAVSSIQSALEPYGITLKHKRGVVEALKLLDNRMPRAVFTDLHIVCDETSGEQAALRHGLTFLDQFLETAYNTAQFPPIWIMTAEDESVVRDHLGDVTSRGYRFIPSNLADQGSFAESGSICVFSNQKRPDKVTHFQNFIKKIFESGGVVVTQDNEITDAGSRIDIEQINWITLPLHGQDFTVLGDIYRQLSEERTLKLIMVHDRCTNMEEISRDLGIWFKHPGLPVLDPIFKEDTKYRLTNHVWHKNIILNLSIDSSLYERFPIQVLYWGLSRNLYMETNKNKEQDVIKIWTTFRHEDRGPFSHWRHDLKNQWSNPDLAQLLKSTIEILNACDNSVSIPNELRQGLDSFAFNDIEALTYLNKGVEKRS